MKGDLREVVEIGPMIETAFTRMMYTTKIGDVLIVLDFIKRRASAGRSDLRKLYLDRIRQRYKKAKEQYGTSKGR